MNDRPTQNGSATGAEEALAAQLTAYALGQLTGDEKAAIEQRLADPAAADARQAVAATRRLRDALLNNSNGDVPCCSASPELRDQLLQRLQSGSETEKVEAVAHVELPAKPSASRSRWVRFAVVGGILCVLVALAIPALLPGGRQSQRVAGVPASDTKKFASYQADPADQATAGMAEESEYNEAAPAPILLANGQSAFVLPQSETETLYRQTDGTRSSQDKQIADLAENLTEEKSFDSLATQAPIDQRDHLTRASSLTAGRRLVRGTDVAGSGAAVNGRGAVEDRTLALEAKVRPYGTTWSFGNVDVDNAAEEVELSVIGSSEFSIVPNPGSEQYDTIVENAFLASLSQPLSTFSIDVDTASYANTRRFLTSGRLPPPSAVRIEELVNYFSYDYPQPKADEPFSVNMEVAACPWNAEHLLMRVGLKGKDVHRAERPKSNLVFLLDVSGSMDEPNKLPLVKSALSMLVQELNENDRVSIAVYAGNAGLVLPPTSGDQKRKILDAIEALTPGGSTHGSAGIQLAYEQAAEYFVKGGTNRVILATDGDLNVGVTSDEALVNLIKQKAAGGVFLTVLGFGEGNLKDSKMEKLADNGNGLYAYIDSLREGRKVLVEQMSGSIVTIAKDVKIQIEFNPAQIESYRLVGYENRMLAAKDFNDDQRDAGEIGAGHTVTAIYELAPVGAKKTEIEASPPITDPLKYQQASGGRQSPDNAATKTTPEQFTEAASSGELLTLKLRYKQPDGDTSKLLEYPLKDRGGSFNAASADMQFASAVASFGMILRGSEHRGSSNLAAVAEIAGGSLGKDDGGYRAEFLDLVRRAQSLGAK